MEQKAQEAGYADRKSRLMYVKADTRAAEWRAVGSITIHAPELEEPLVLDKAGYTVVFKESGKEGDLRKALVTLKQRYRHRRWWETPFWLFAGFVLGVSIRRLVLTLL